jgi:hypothetical protein
MRSVLIERERPMIQRLSDLASLPCYKENVMRRQNDIRPVAVWFDVALGPRV